MAATWHAVKSTLSSVKGNVVPDPVDPVMMHEHVSDRVFTSKILRVCSWYPQCMLDVSYLMLAECLTYSCMSQCMQQHVCHTTFSEIHWWLETFVRDTALPKTMTLCLIQVRTNFKDAHQYFLKPFAS